MATAKKTTFNVYIDVPGVQVTMPVAAETFEEAITTVRQLPTIKVLTAEGVDFVDYGKAEINGIYKG